MKNLVLSLLALLPIALYAQTLPLDFEIPEDDAWAAFNGATATVVTDPTDGTNSVLELTSNGVDFDGASINLGTYIDLSDDNNNIITLQFWTPDATTRTHLLKLEGASNGPAATELYFDTTASGWQTITLDFGPGLADDYPILVLFADAGSGNTATGTYYIDNIDGPNGAAIPLDPIPTSAAPVPNVPDSEVYSVYNDSNGFSTAFPVSYTFGTLSGEPDLDPTATENKALKFNFGVAGWGQGEGGPDDVSAYNFVSFDYWAAAGLVGFDFVLISNSGGITEHAYKVGVDGPVVNDTWTKVEIPMSFFTNLGFASNALWQWKIGPLNNSIDNDGIAYVDNVLFTQNTLGASSFDLSGFSVYPNPTQNTWNIQVENTTIQSVEILNALGQSVKRINFNNSSVSIDASDLAAGLYFAKIQNESNQIYTTKLVKN